MPNIADKMAICMVVIIHVLLGKICASVSEIGIVGLVKRCNGVERINDTTYKQYTKPTITMEYVSARGTLRCGFSTILNRDAAHSKPKKPKITKRVALKILVNP